MTKIAGSGSISQRHRSADPDPDPDPPQNDMDPQHCAQPCKRKSVIYLTNADQFEALVLRQLGFDGNELARQFVHGGVGGRDEKDARHLRLVLGVAARAPHLQHHAHNGGGLPGARRPLHQS
jgi:hypothetical protein